MLAVRTSSCVLRSQQPGSVSPWQDRQPLSLLQSEATRKQEGSFWCLTSKTRFPPSASPFPLEAVDNAGPLLASWKAGVFNHHLQINYFYLGTDHLLLSHWRHTGLSPPRWQMPSCPQAASLSPSHREKLLCSGTRLRCRSSVCCSKKLV